MNICEAVKITMRPVDPGIKYYHKDCVDRQCQNCGVENVGQSVADLLVACGDDNIEWLHWDTQH